MKRTPVAALLPLLIPALGILGLLLEFWMYTAGIDYRGLLISGHPAWILLIILSVAVTAFLIFHCRQDKEQGTYHQNFPATPMAMVGNILQALGIYLLSLSVLLNAPDSLNTVTAILGLVSATLLVVAGFCRWKGKRPSFLYHALLCVFFAVHLFCQYRHWSFNPQIQDYCFKMLAEICLMMTAYQRATFCLNIGSRRLFRFFSMASVFFCCLALGVLDQVPFYLTAGIGVAFDLCAPTLPDQETQAS